jgi:BASS family bile acid:Na+ symporter
LKEVHIDLWEMIRLVALLLAVPLAAGMAVRAWKPMVALRLGKLFKSVSLLFFLFLIFLALYNNRGIFQEYVGMVFALVLFHNLAALATGFAMGHALRLPGKDIKSITLETGIQNSGLGLLLIFTFFEGLGGMALLAAFWGIWHLVSGLALASLWGWVPSKTESML